MNISKKVFRYIRVFLLHWVLFGFIFIICLMYRDYLDFGRFVRSSFFDYLMIDYWILSMLIFLYPLFFAFLISLSFYKGKNIMFLWILLFCLCFPYVFVFYEVLGLFIICTPFIFWYYYFQYLNKKGLEL